MLRLDEVRIKARSIVGRQIRRGGREVSNVPDYMGLGNVLYQWLWTYQGQAAGKKRGCLANSRIMPWLTVFPEAAAALVVLPDEVKLRDRLIRPWLMDEHRSTSGDRYDEPLLEEFCRRCCSPASVTPRTRAASWS